MSRGVASTSGNAQLEVGVIRSATTQVGTVRMEGQIIASPLAHLAPVFGRRVEGILGGDWLKRNVVELDFVTRKMRLYDPVSFGYSGGGVTLPMTLVNGIPFVQLEVSLPNKKSIKGAFLVDTAGGWMTVHLYQRIAEPEGLLEELPTMAETGLGIGGETQRVAARGSSLTIGPYRMDRPVVMFTEDLAGLRANPGSIGLVGMEVFRKFRVTFDYSRSVIHLEPNERLKESFFYDTSGLRLHAAPPAFSPPTVAGVRDSSPAQTAGIVPGDAILKLNGKDTSALPLETVREILHGPDQTHALTLLRAEKRIEVTLKTREMLP